MDKKYKCKMCGYRFRFPKITTEKEFNNECRSFVYKDILCYRCNNISIVEREFSWLHFIIWPVIGSILFVFLFIFS